MMLSHVLKILVLQRYGRSKNNLKTIQEGVLIETDDSLDSIATSSSIKV